MQVKDLSSRYLVLFFSFYKTLKTVLHSIFSLLTPSKVLSIPKTITDCLTSQPLLFTLEHIPDNQC